MLKQNLILKRNQLITKNLVNLTTTELLSVLKNSERDEITKFLLATLDTLEEIYYGEIDIKNVVIK